MDKMTAADFKKIDNRFGDDVLACFDYEHSVEMHSAAGGTAKSSVLDQIEVLMEMWQ
jgi:argininosuccinate lyase